MDIRPRLTSAANRPPASVDGVNRPMLQAAPRPTSEPTKAPRPFQRPRSTAPKHRHRLWQRVQLPVILLASIIGGFFIKSSVVGVPLVLGYGVLALVLRVPSRTSFILAAAAIGAVSLSLLFSPNAELVGNFTTYAFLLLAIGVIGLAIEARPRERRKKRRKTRLRG